MPPKVAIHPQGLDFFTTMPCLLPERYGKFGCKVVSRIHGRTPAIKSELTLFDSKTGDMAALINCDRITAMRTGAVAALAIATLESSNARTYAIMGLGVIGHATLDCLLALKKNENIEIKLLRYKDHAETAIKEYAHYPNVCFVIADTVEELVADSDVVISCITQADHDLVTDTSLFKPGVLVVPVHTRGFLNCDWIFDRVIADDEGHVKGFKYYSGFHNFAELGEVLSGKKPGRESDTERILAYNVGIALHDVLFATKILNQLEKSEQ